MCYSIERICKLFNFSQFVTPSLKFSFWGNVTPSNVTKTRISYEAEYLTVNIKLYSPKLNQCARTVNSTGNSIIIS